MKFPILLPNIFNHPFTYESDINLKTDIKECVKLNFKSFLNIFLQPKEVTDGIEYIKGKFQKEGEDNIRILKKEIMSFYETL